MQANTNTQMHTYAHTNTRTHTYMHNSNAHLQQLRCAGVEGALVGHDHDVRQECQSGGQNEACT